MIRRLKTLTVFLLIALGCYSQESDTLCVRKSRAIELIKKEIQLDNCLAVDSQRVEQIRVYELRLETCEGKVADLMAINANTSDMNAVLRKDNDLLRSELDRSLDQLKKEKLFKKIIIGGAIAINLATLYLTLGR